MTRSGIVTVVGKPNTGKSTLLNRIIGQKLSITSEKPQSTRDRIVGIHTTDETQMVVFDTPGLLDPAYALQQSMQHAAISALNDADVIVYLVDARDETPPTLTEAIGNQISITAPVITVRNKIDLIPQTQQRRSLDQHPDVEHDANRVVSHPLLTTVAISALTGEGVDTLLNTIGAYLPESPFLYPEDEISTQSLRFFAAELIRETALEQLSEELPYSLACEIDEFRESRTPVYIRAILYVERDSQKRIIIGEKGRKIREIGSAARQKIERLVGNKVYLDLWVKVLQNWRKNADALRRLGYELPQREDR